MSITKYNQFLQVCPPAVSLLTLGRNEVTSSRPTSFFKTFFLKFYIPTCFPFLLSSCPFPVPIYPLPIHSSSLLCCEPSSFFYSKTSFPLFSTSFLNALFPLFLCRSLSTQRNEVFITHLTEVLCLLQTSGADIASRVPCSVYIDAVTSLLFVLCSTYCNWAFNVTFPLSLSVSSLSPYTVDFISPLPTDCIRGY